MSMRFLLGLLFISSFIMSAGCSALESAAYLTPIPDATLMAYRIGSPIENKLDAVIVGRKMLWVMRTHPIGTPEVTADEELRLEDAYHRIGWTGAHYEYWPRNISVWLVIFEGQWQLIFPVPGPQGVVPTLQPPYHGCQFSLFAASNGEPISGGDVKCPSKK